MITSNVKRLMPRNYDKQLTIRHDPPTQFVTVTFTANSSKKTTHPPHLKKTNIHSTFLLQKMYKHNSPLQILKNKHTHLNPTYHNILAHSSPHHNKKNTNLKLNPTSPIIIVEFFSSDYIGTSVQKHLTPSPSTPSPTP